MAKTVEKQMEMRGMKRQELVNYFIEIGGDEVSAGSIKGIDEFGAEWQVKLTKEAIIKIGSLDLPTTMVTIKADAAMVDTLVAAFRMKFLSAGG